MAMHMNAETSAAEPEPPAQRVKPVGQAGQHELVGIAFSHFVEKARWALHRFGVPVRERKVLPFFHFAVVYQLHRGKLGRAERHSTRFSTPVLRTDDGRLLCDSADIVSYASTRFAPTGEDLYFTPEAARLEQHFSEELGPATRLVAYDAFFSQPALLHAVAEHNVGRSQALAFRAAHRLLGGRMASLIGLEPKRLARARELVARELDAISKRLGDERPYLLGDRFSAADLSFACLAAPTVLPPQYSAWLPPLEAFSHEVQANTRAFRDTPAGAFALRMFAEERSRVVAHKQGNAS
jgi:glutathione S-transferase